MISFLNFGQFVRNIEWDTFYAANTFNIIGCVPPKSRILEGFIGLFIAIIGKMDKWNTFFGSDWKQIMGNLRGLRQRAVGFVNYSYWEVQKQLIIVHEIHSVFRKCGMVWRFVLR